MICIHRPNGYNNKVGTPTIGNNAVKKRKACTALANPHGSLLSVELYLKNKTKDTKPITISTIAINLTFCNGIVVSTISSAIELS